MPINIRARRPLFAHAAAIVQPNFIGKAYRAVGPCKAKLELSGGKARVISSTIARSGKAGIFIGDRRKLKRYHSHSREQSGAHAHCFCFHLHYFLKKKIL
jgi:hypothetical protein